MIIKYYTTDESLIIIDDVTDVRVPANVSTTELTGDAWKIFYFDPPMPDTGHPIKFITYGKDGPCALAIHGFAYICTNEGRTIEKVEAY